MLSERRACRTRSANTTRRRAETAELFREFATSGFVNIVGGCCGTTPEHIARIAEAVAVAAAQAAAIERRLRLSGLEPLNIGPTIACS